MIKQTELTFYTAIDILECDSISSKIKFYFGTERKPFLVDASIKQENSLIGATFDIKGLLPKCGVHSFVFFDGIKKKDYEFEDTFLYNLPIKISKVKDFSASSIETSFKHEMCTVKLRSISYTMTSKVLYKDTYKIYRFTEMADALKRQLRRLSVFDISTEHFEGQYKSNVFYAKFTDNHVYLQYGSDIDELLSVLSFFFCTPVRYDKCLSSNDDGVITIDTISTYGTCSKRENDMLMYLFINDDCLNRLPIFLNSINGNFSTEVQRFIEYYVRCESLDEISQLIIYCSILEKIAGATENGDSYNQIKAYLKKHSINTLKINSSVECENIPYKNNAVTNFYELRNLFVHHLGDKDAEDFLMDSDMLFYLKETITIIILNLLGMKFVSFDRNFQHLSVISDSVKITK